MKNMNITFKNPFETKRTRTNVCPGQATELPKYPTWPEERQTSGFYGRGVGGI